MDKGTDSEEIHHLIRNSMESVSLIPIRNRKRKRISGYYSRKIMVSFDPNQYHKRNKVKTVFSVLEIKFDESLKARKYRLQVKEIKNQRFVKDLPLITKEAEIIDTMDIIGLAKICQDEISEVLSL